MSRSSLGGDLLTDLHGYPYCVNPTELGLGWVKLTPSAMSAFATQKFLRNDYTYTPYAALVFIYHQEMWSSKNTPFTALSFYSRIMRRSNFSAPIPPGIPGDITFFSLPRSFYHSIFYLAPP